MHNAMRAEVKVGCCGFVLSQQEYFKHFNHIEIQQTFYQLPRLQTAEKWRKIAPAGFEFTMATDHPRDNQPNLPPPGKKDTA